MQTFVKTLVLSELKQSTIRQCIVQAAGPKSVITPTLFGLGAKMGNIFGSKWLINELSRPGFSISYDEVNRCKQSVIQAENLQSMMAEYDLPSTFTQWVADNVDHSISTLKGEGTFYGLVMIAVSASEDETSPTSTFTARVINKQKLLEVNYLVKDIGVPIIPYTSPPQKLITYKPVLELQHPYTLPSEMYADLLWHSGWIFISRGCLLPWQLRFTGIKYTIPICNIAQIR